MPGGHRSVPLPGIPPYRSDCPHFTFYFLLFTFFTLSLPPGRDATHFFLDADSVIFSYL